MRTCELCEKTQNKDKRGKNQAKKLIFLHEEVIDFFHNFLYFHNRKLFFNPDHVQILGSTEYGNNRCNYLYKNK